MEFTNPVILENERKEDVLLRCILANIMVQLASEIGN